MSGAVEIAIQAAGEASAYAAQFKGKKPSGAELVKLHKLASSARWAVEAAFEFGSLTAEEEWQLVTRAAIPVETLIAVNMALVKDAKAAASTIRSLVAQAKDLDGVTQAAQASLELVDRRAQLILAHSGKPGDLAPDWTQLTECPGADFWEPCPSSWWPLVLVVVGLVVAWKYRLI